MRSSINNIFILLATIFLSSPVYAACVGTPGTITQVISMGAITVQRDTPVGTVIGSRTIGSTVTGVITCDPDFYYLTYGMVYNGGVGLGDNIYQTNVAGVGIRISQSGSSTYFSNPPYVSGTRNYTGKTGLTSAPDFVEFIKVSSITSGVMATGNVANYYVTTNASSGSSVGTQTQINMGVGNSITQLACSISTPNIQVPLDDVLASSLTGVNMTAKPKVFNVGLQCDAGARINAKLTGIKNVDTSAVGVLQLTGAGNSDVAKGVGIQILYNGSPINLNSNMVLKTSAGGQETFPFTAQYYQTKASASVTTGSANATATLELTYQ